MSEENAPIEEPKPSQGGAETTTVSKPAMPPAVALAFVIIALLGVLIVVTLRGNRSTGSSSADIEELQAKTSELRARINRERVAMGKLPLESGTETMEDIAARLKKDADAMVAMAVGFQKILAEKDVEISTKSADLIQAEQIRQGLSVQITRLQEQLQHALVNGSDADLLRREMDALKSQRDALAAELAKVRDELATKGQGVSADDYADLQRRLEESQRAKSFFEARATDLEGQLSKAKLFAKSEDELLPAAVELFRNLRKLEGKSDAEISTAYSSLGASLGANVLHTLNFATGSSELAPADQDLIRSLVADIPDGDLVLVIGYASETGNLDANQTLSSARATAAAELFSSVKRPEQKVQAVYLGQTDRFSSRIPERNQIVEIWRIRKK